MKKSSYLLFLFVVMVLSCLLCGLKGCNTQTKEAINSDTTEEETVATFSGPQPIKFDDKEPITLKVGEAKVIEVSDEDEKSLQSWTSSDDSIVSVDDGGRIDAKKIGTATITAKFSDKESNCKVTVEKADDVTDTDTFSTAITANTDILNQNINSSYTNPYAIYVNRKMNTVTVYTYDENGDYTIPVRAMVCSCGKSNGTITGEFETYFTNEWHALFDNVYGHYVSGISGDYLFHSVPYYTTSPDKLEVEEFNKLGTDASLGCVRMAIADTKWIYENCAVGTYVKIYDDDNPGPLGKPDTIKITDMSCGWDPTDDDENNPYNSKKPVIKGAQDVIIKKGDNYTVEKGITALDTCSNDITDKLCVVGNVITTKTGTYKVTYQVKDALNRTAKTDITVTVTD